MQHTLLHPGTRKIHEQAPGKATATPPSPGPHDGALGTPELPGYRLGRVVVRLADLPQVDAQHLYFHLLWMGDDGGVQDDHSGPCEALARDSSIEQRTHFVRVVCELVRHTPSHDRGLAALGQALNFIRRNGIEGQHLMLAAQLLDAATHESAVVASLADLLSQALGTDAALLETQAAMRQLSLRADVAAPLHATSTASPDAPADHELALRSLLTQLVHGVGKARARRCLSEAIDQPLLPQAALSGR
jgi:hypothetical protein